MNNAIIAKRIPGVEPPSLVLVDAFRHQEEKDCQFFCLSHFHGGYRTLIFIVSITRTRLCSCHGVFPGPSA